MSTEPSAEGMLRATIASLRQEVETLQEALAGLRDWCRPFRIAA